KQLRFDYSHALSIVNEQQIEAISKEVLHAHHKLYDRNGAGHEFLGWLDLPARYDQAELTRIQKAALRIREQSEVLIIIGIGGSYLGARAAIEMLSHTFYNELS